MSNNLYNTNNSHYGLTVNELQDNLDLIKGATKSDLF